MIRDIEEQSTKEFPLTEPSQFIALDRARTHFRDLEHQYRVFISLRRSTDNSSLVQGSPEKANEPHAPPSGSLFITGRPERIDQLYEEEIRPMLPIEEEFPVAQEFHRGLIVNLSTERRGRNVQTGPPVRGERGTQSTEDSGQQSETPCKAAEIKQKYNVLIRLPPQNAAGANVVYLRGTPAQLSSAKAELAEWVKHCEELKADRIARNFELSLSIPTRFISWLLSIKREFTQAQDVLMFITPGSSVVAVNGTCEPRSEVITNGHNAETAVTVNENALVDGDISKRLNDADHENGDDDVEDCKKANLVDGKPQESSKAHSTCATQSIQERLSTVVLRGYQQ
ncbi:High-density lipoprotein receptor (Hdl) [Fasciola gigantica]|uniref:High-density lipoprotein receptor (Hdl) n=1 Tax=Fasciola gigantica TaxID=46835 RepID=A0A504Z8Q8_FASGI|nr:High-density lipoprotein receptor (Hdl) [Fasciola gigantica]